MIDFMESLYYRNLRSGLPMRVILNGKVVSEETARRIIASAQLNGFLPPQRP
jgi:hypothetical protein